MIRSIRKLLVLPVALGLAACDNPVEHEDHPQGLVVLDAQGTEVARHTVGGGTTSQIAVGLDATQTFTVHAVAEDGDHILIDGDELEVRVDEPAAGWTMVVQGTNQLVIGASAQGTALVRLTLYHNAHEEFSADFDVSAG